MTIVFLISEKQEQVPCVCLRILHILLKVETVKQELQRQMQEAAAMQAESQLYSFFLSFVLAKMAKLTSEAVTENVVRSTMLGVI